MIHQDIQPETEQDASFDPSFEKQKLKLKKQIVKQKVKKEKQRELSPYSRMQQKIQKIKEAKAADDYMGGDVDLDMSGTSSVIYQKQAEGKYKYKPPAGNS